MKAMRVHAYGGPEVLHLDEVSKPTPASGQVLLKVIACGINPVDAWFRNGVAAERFPRPLPYTPGADVVGVVEQQGEGADRFPVGTRLMGVLPILSEGGYGEYVVGDVDRFVELPEGVDPVLAVAAMTPSITGRQMIDRALAHGPCRRMLVFGALGGVGRTAVALAVEKGIEVTALVRPGREDEARALGAANVLTGNDPSVTAQWRGAFDCILDLLGPEAVVPWEDAIAANGVMITAIPLQPGPFKRDDFEVVRFAYNPTIDALTEAVELMRQGKITPANIETIAIEEIPRAHEALLGAGNKGRKFVIVAQP